MNASTLEPPIVSRAEWQAVHAAHREREKVVTRMRDELAAARRTLPWTRVDEPYVFESPAGPCTLADLFAGRSELIVKHFMFGPGWQEDCVGCSFEVDHIEATLVHLNHHDVSVVAVARAPMAEIEPFKQRMGWHLPWVSSSGNRFNYDFHVSFTPAEMARGRVYYNYAEREFSCEELSGLSVFRRGTDGAIYHTFSTFGRGAEELLGSYMLLDLTSRGRNENGPRHDMTDWVRHHDRYDAPGHVGADGRYLADTDLADTNDTCCAAMRPT